LTLFHFGESLQLSKIRELLLKLKEEVGVCLMRLDSAVDGLLGREHKLNSHKAQPNPRGKFTLKQPTVAFKPNTKVFKPKRKTVFFNEKLLVDSGVGQ
jgi:hypothetical protein